MYHEKQVRELCAMHALNNLFQNKLFTKEELDFICETLNPSKWLNPHRSIFGTGNYDINVIMSALQTKGHELIWFDCRKNPSSIVLENVVGFILNIPNNYAFGVLKLPFNRRHWHSIRCVDGDYYNFDSKLLSPLLIGKEDELIEYLRTQLEDKKELFIVVQESVAQTKSWLAESGVTNS